tara:strand:+ start:126 stop:272 length:147 start_codon:yes stop_codon:yes gene_type:complete
VVMKPIEVIKKLVKDNPNDMMLGEEVRLYIRELVEIENKRITNNPKRI